MTIRKKDLVFIISLVIIFAQYIRIIDFNYYTQFVIAGVWVGYDWLCALRCGGLKKIYPVNIWNLRQVFVVPWMCIFAYSLLMCMLGNNLNVPIKTILICNITILINMFFSFSAIRIFGKRALNNSLVALAIIFILTTVRAIIKKGIFVVFIELYNIFTTFNSTHNPFEISDCTFAAGLFLLVYLFFGKRKTKKETKYLIICAVYILLGFKRIQMFSLLLVIVVGVILRMISSDFVKNAIMNSVSVIITVVASVYVWFVDCNDLLSQWTSLDMGRYHLYSFINGFYDFSTSFIGHGYGFSNKFVELNTNYSIIVLHSDILRMFVELGFFGFYLWLLYYFVVARKKIQKRYGINLATIYFFETVYLMMLHFTDNTVNYFVTQYFYCITVASCIIDNYFIGNIGEKNNE